MLLYNNLLALPLMVAYMVVGTREVQEIRYFPQLDDPLFLVRWPGWEDVSLLLCLCLSRVAVHWAGVLHRIIASHQQQTSVPVTSRMHEQLQRVLSVLCELSKRGSQQHKHSQPNAWPLAACWLHHIIKASLPYSSGAIPCSLTAMHITRRCSCS